jgi:hypothetical protein
MRRAALVSILLTALATTVRSDYLADRARPVVEASHAEIRAVHLGRYMSQGRWNELLDEALWTMAPKGRWSPEHPAWQPAREALARVLREASVARLAAGETGRLVREVVNERYSSLDADDAAKAVAFYESPGGRVFRDFREKVLAETSYGLPYVIEKAPRETLRREMEEAKDRLLNLPDEQTQAVYDFNHSKVGEFLMGIENNIVADVIGNLMQSDMTGLLNRDDAPAMFRRVRAAVPSMPPPSDKEYLGTLTMRSDRGFDLAIEYHESFRTAGTYRLSYPRSDVHWQDVAAGAPGIKPGETRFLYRDPRGRLSDAP